MKYLALISLLALAVVLAGCASTGEAIRDKVMDLPSGKPALYYMKALNVLAYVNYKLQKLEPTGTAIALPSYGAPTTLRTMMVVVRNGDPVTEGHRYELRYHCTNCYVQAPLYNDAVHILGKGNPTQRVEKGALMSPDMTLYSSATSSPCGEPGNIKVQLVFIDKSTNKEIILQSLEQAVISKGSGPCVQ